MKKSLILGITLVASGSIAFVQNSSSTLTEESLNQLIKDTKSTEVHEIVGNLPEVMRLNFVLKHGIKRQGERGHLVEKKVSQSADPQLPRAILWNEKSGFSVSYNGGGEGQTSPDRLDIIRFDDNAKTFHLSKVEFPLTEEQIQSETSVVEADSSCQECHGPRQRPIFSMYPDWPSFYGSDNDELNNPASEMQKSEFADFRNFRENVANKHPRYSPLYNNDLVKKAYNMSIWRTYPFRQNTSEVSTDISRSFSFRPGLRLGIVYARQNSQSTFKTMKDNKNYDKYALLALHSLLQCSWNTSYPKTRDAFRNMVKADLPNEAMWIGGDGLQLHYHQIWQLFGLKINDVDIRYSYNHEGYKNMDASKKIMEPGYIGKYFNSYFDGTATTDELIAAKLLNDLSIKYPELKGTYTLRGLTEKYRGFKDRFAYDENTFKNFDRMGRWFAMPYPRLIANAHHRERFSDNMQSEYNSVCKKTVELMKKQLFN